MIGEYYKVRVSFETEVDNGKKTKILNKVREYIVNALSTEEATLKINKYLKTSTEPFQVKSVSDTKTEDYIP